MTTGHMNPHRTLRAAALILMLASLGGCCGRTLNVREGVAFAPDAETSPVATFRVLTWNLNHFVDQYDNPYIRNEWDDRHERMTPERIDLFVRAIKGVNADVVVFEELESAAFLQSLARERFPEMGYKHFGSAEEFTWHQNVVVMSRFPLGVVSSFGAVMTPIEGQTVEGGGPAAQDLTNHRLIAVEVFVGRDYDFLLLAMHLKAGGGPRNQGWRKGQVDFVRAWLGRQLYERPKANVLAVGDFNAPPESPEMQDLLGAAGSGVRFVDPLAGEKMLTMPSRNRRVRIDYILPNTNMSPELVAGSEVIPEPLAREDLIKVTDHLPVVAEFRAHDE